ncbi:MAG: uridine diphosphate-N-acetylglucosamine-binding protein YvcK [Acidimicrobiales bacterium]|nr:uridine diphosphate-N-acetylglucosamine-binding protein YvcK [Acidimicrobiales bacterium]
MTGSGSNTSAASSIPAPVGAVVAVGGGHGLAASLRAIRTYAASVTAVVSVADDGGSSGRLREEFPILPAPGDARRCLGALAATDSQLGLELEHRFGPESGSLSGHAYGNLLLAALTFGLGSFQAALAEVGRMTGAVGVVLPATDGPVQLTGQAVDAGDGAKRVVGQVAVARAIGRRYVALEPADATSPPQVRESILAADQVVIGPGSLFTSVLAAAIVPEVRRALHDTSAQRVYVANLAPQVPETAGFSLGDHLDVLSAHDIPVDIVLAPTRSGPDSTGEDLGSSTGRWTTVERSLAMPGGGEHDPALLAVALSEVAALGRPEAPAAFAAPREVN